MIERRDTHVIAGVGLLQVWAVRWIGVGGGEPWPLEERVLRTGPFATAEVERRAPAGASGAFSCMDF